MSAKPTYEELKQRIRALEIKAAERVEAEEKLRWEKRRLDSLVQHSALAIVTLDKDHNIVSCNRNFEALFHLDETVIVGQNLDEVLGAGETLEDAKSYTAMTLRGESIRGSGKRYRGDGTLIDVEFYGVPVIVDGAVISAYGLYMDISEQTAAQEALREREKKYRNILKSIEEGYYEVDLAGNFTFLNDSMAGIFGYSMDEIKNSNFRNYSDQEVAKQAYDAFNRVYTTGRPAEGFVWEIIRKDGSKRVVEASASLARDSEGKITGFYGIVRDITDKRRSEEALKQSEERYRTLVEESFDGIFVQKGLKIAFANGRLHEMLGYDAGELLGLDHWVVYHPDYHQLTRERAQARMRGEKVTARYEVKLQRKDGSWFYGELNARPIVFDEESGVQVWIKDITEQKLSEKVLRESEEKYRLLFENANDAIFIAQDEVIKFPNPKVEALIGYSADELTSIRFAGLIYPEDREMVLENHIRRLRGEKVPTTYSFRVTPRNGETLWVQLNAVLITWEGRPATLNFLRDITLQKKMEAQLQQAQKMEAIGTLAGGIAHDFNNLLMAVQGSASLMLMDTDPVHSHHNRLKNIEQYVKRGAELTKQLLAFARGGKYDVKPTDLNELLKKSFGIFGRTKKEITIHKTYQEDIWAVEVDPGQMDQVLLNLYINAWQAMPGGGELYVETENVMLGEPDVKPFGVGPGGYVRISVTDTGVGMDETTQKKIFDPFFTTKEIGRGTGLGLASAYGIIRNHGGIINVYSEEGHGATFNIYLPATEAKINGKHSEVPKDFRPGHETILLVDDEEMIIETGREMLETMGYGVLTAYSGKEAIDTYAKNRDQIDLVILDMIMPEMSGGKIYDSLKEADPEVVVLLSSGYSINGQATEILGRGCNGFIQKPYNIKQLSQEIRRVLDL